MTNAPATPEQIAAALNPGRDPKAQMRAAFMATRGESIDTARARTKRKKRKR